MGTKPGKNDPGEVTIVLDDVLLQRVQRYAKASGMKTPTALAYIVRSYFTSFEFEELLSRRIGGMEAALLEVRDLLKETRDGKQDRVDGRGVEPGDGV